MESSKNYAFKKWLKCNFQTAENDNSLQKLHYLEYCLDPTKQTLPL